MRYCNSLPGTRTTAPQHPRRRLNITALNPITRVADLNITFVG